MAMLAGYDVDRNIVLVVNLLVVVAVANGDIGVGGDATGGNSRVAVCYNSLALVVADTAGETI